MGQCFGHSKKHSLFLKILKCCILVLFIHYNMKGAFVFALSAICIGALVSGHAIKTKTTYTVKDHKKLVGCYVGTWAYYRPGYGNLMLIILMLVFAHMVFTDLLI